MRDPAPRFALFGMLLEQAGRSWFVGARHAVPLQAHTIAAGVLVAGGDCQAVDECAVARAVHEYLEARGEVEQVG